MRHIVPVEEVIQDTVFRLLQPCQTILPGSQEKVLHALDRGKRIEQAGRALLEIVQEHIASTLDSEKAQRDTLSLKIHDLEKKIEQANTDLETSRREQKRFEITIKEDQKELTALRNTISTQNRLLAKQHEQIINLTGIQDEDVRP